MGDYNALKNNLGEQKSNNYLTIPFTESGSPKTKSSIYRNSDENLLKPGDGTSLVQSDHSYDTVIENPLHDDLVKENGSFRTQDKLFTTNSPSGTLNSPPSSILNPNFNNKRVFDWWATQISDSDDENWFVPRFSKRRIASTVHTFQKPEFAVVNHKIIQSGAEKTAEEFCDIDLSSSVRKLDNYNDTSMQKKGWSNFTAKLLPKGERRYKRSNEKLNEAPSSDDETLPKHASNSTLYLPPFQMVGRIDEPDNHPSASFTRPGKSRGKTRSKSNKNSSDISTKITPNSNLLTSLQNSTSNRSTFSTCSSSTLKLVERSSQVDNETKNIPGNQNKLKTDEVRNETIARRPSLASLSCSNFITQPPYVHVPDQIRDFHLNSKEEDSDSSWIMQTSSRRLVRCTKDSAAIARRRSLVESLLGSIYPRRRAGVTKSSCHSRGRGCKRQLSREDISSCDSSRRNSSNDFGNLNFHDHDRPLPYHWQHEFETDFNNGFSQGPDNGKSDLGNRQMSLNNFSDISDWCDCSWCLERAPSASSWFADDSEDTGTLTEYSTTSDLGWKRRSACEALAIRPKRKQKLWTNSVQELQVMLSSYRAGLTGLGARLVKELRRRDRNIHIQRQRCDMITALLHALSLKRREL
ncbi:hypothetical protein FHG87_003442 [Trinorchestia longiramus]|nr:hypothetical protein FHG87_003442 [Trinorchestia longiramus]